MNIPTSSSQQFDAASMSHEEALKSSAQIDADGSSWVSMTDPKSYSHDADCFIDVDVEHAVQDQVPEHSTGAVPCHAQVLPRSDSPGQVITVPTFTTAEAYPVLDALGSPYPHASASSASLLDMFRSSAYIADTTVESSAALATDGQGGHMQLRPEYIFVKISKNQNVESLGLFLRKYRYGDGIGYGGVCGSGVYISKIQPTSPLAKTPLRAGDQILSINGVSCCTTPREGTGPKHSSSRKIRVQDVVNLIKRAPKGMLSIVVRNAKGDPNLVSSTVQKPKDTAKVGLALRNKQGSVVISRVHSDGLFGGSLLVEGHRCIQVNRTRCDTALIRSIDAANLIAEASDFVTVISRPRDAHSAMVLSNIDMHHSHGGGRWRNARSLVEGVTAVGAALLVGPSSALTSTSVTPTATADPIDVMGMSSTDN